MRGSLPLSLTPVPLAMALDVFVCFCASVPVCPSVPLCVCACVRVPVTCVLGVRERACVLVCVCIWRACWACVPVCAQVPKGSVLLLNNLIPHRSLPNNSNGIRWSLDLRWQKPDEPNGFSGIKVSRTCYPACLVNR